MADAILVLNAGSSSLKFTGYLVDDQQGLAKIVSGKAEELTGADAVAPDARSLLGAIESFL